jgi:hypothetical protein
MFPNLYVITSTHTLYSNTFIIIYCSSSNSVISFFVFVLLIVMTV